MIGRIVATNPLEYLDEITEFCRIAFDESGDKNMSLDIGIHSSSLLRHIKNKTIPMITMVMNDTKVISLSGVQKYSNQVCILGKRFYTLKQYRKSPMGKPNNFFQDYMYEPQLTWSINYGFKVALITFNEHNKKLIPVLEREQRKDRSFQSFKKHDKMMNINSTEQYVFYKKIDENFNMSDLDVR